MKSDNIEVSVEDFGLEGRNDRGETLLNFLL